MVATRVAADRARRPSVEKVRLIYARVSEPESTRRRRDRGEEVRTGVAEKDEVSIRTQIEACRAWARERGYIVPDEHVYSEVYTGVELWERPALTDAREAMRRGDVGGAIVFAIDRLARDPTHLGVLLCEAEHAGAAVDFVSEPLDDTAEGALIRYIRGYAAKVEHEKIRERTMRGRRARAQAGRYIPGATPRFGYLFDVNKTRLVVEPTSAAVVRRIFEAIDAGGTIRGVATALNADGVRSSTGKHWRFSAVRNVLTWPGYAGRAFAFLSGAKPGTRGRVRTSERRLELPPGTVPAIVDLATYERVQARLERNKTARRAHPKHPELALLRGGFVRCGFCGGAVHIGTKVLADGSIDHVYVCSKRTEAFHTCPGRGQITGRLLDRVVWEAIRELVADPSRVAAAIARVEREDVSAHDLVAVDRKAAELTRRRGNLVAQLEELDPDSADVVRERLEVIAHELRALAKERAAVGARRGQWEAARATLELFVEGREAAAGDLDGLDFAGKQRLLADFGVAVRVWRHGHTPRYEIRTSLLPMPIYGSGPLRALRGGATGPGEAGDHLTDDHTLLSVGSITTALPLVLRWTDKDFSVELSA